MKKGKFKERLQYWFDSRMSKGSLALVKILITCTVVFVVLVGFLLFLIDYDSLGLSIFDTLSTVINAWMPEAAGEEVAAGHLILKSIAAVFGLLLTSVLIGIISSAIEEKITDLRRGNSVVLESGHIVVLGFVPGEFTLLEQIILAEGDDPACIVVAEDMDRDEMEQEIRDNLEYGKNIRIICRKADILDPVSLEKCSIQTARSVIVSPADNARTVKTLLALSSLVRADSGTDVKIGAVVSTKQFKFPETEAKKHNITTLNTNDIIARIIAHTCTQAGLSVTFNELLSFEGSELYTIDLPTARGLSFSELLGRMDNGVPLGIVTDGHVTLNPEPSRRILEDDRILVFAPDDKSACLSDAPVPVAAESTEAVTPAEPQADDTAIIGYNRMIPLILWELPEHPQHIIFVGLSEEEKALLQPALADNPHVSAEYCNDTLSVDENLRALCERVEHIVILSSYEKEDDAADLDSISKILHLRDIRERFGLRFNITAEMRRENNQRLIAGDDNTDFIVASNLSSLFLAQFAENPELLTAFRELLSNEGNELYLKSAASLNCLGDLTTAEIRRRAYQKGCIFLGCHRITETGFTNEFDPPLNQSFRLDADDQLIVISAE